MEKFVRKTKVNWLVSDTTLIAFDKFQATIYHAYDNPNKQPLEEMKKRVLLSEREELNSWVDVINLAVEKGMKGYGTKLRREWFAES